MTGRRGKQREQPESTELFIGLVGATGTDLNKVESFLEKALSNVAYDTVHLRLSALLYDISGGGKLASKNDPEDRRIHHLQDAGNGLRAQLKNGAAMAVAVLTKILETRDARTTQAQSSRCAYILNSLKHPMEVAYLRGLYGDSFVLVSAFSERGIRRTNLAKRIADSHNQTDSREFYSHAEAIMKRDEREQNNEYGQNVRDTFPKADVFVDVRDDEQLERSLVRFIELWFGNVLVTPQRHETAMFHAYAASLRSADLGRQVGAVVATTDGDIVALGTNEVPKPGGGQYWEGDDGDDRDIRKREDINVTFKRGLFGELIDKLVDAGWLTLPPKKTPADVVDEILPETQLSGLLEFGRSVHAEMAALVDAARRGVSIDRCTLFTTTYPCHLCAKHIVAAGITEIVYIEPFPKSRASMLYLDSTADGVRVGFHAFVGVAPRQYMRLFGMTANRPRKDSTTGKVIDWIARDSSPRYGERLETYAERERKDLDNFQEAVDLLEFVVADNDRVRMQKKLARPLFEHEKQ